MRSAFFKLLVLQSLLVLFARNILAADGFAHSRPVLTRRVIFDSNSGGGEIFRTRPDRPWDPPSLL